MFLDKPTLCTLRNCSLDATAPGARKCNHASDLANWRSRELAFQPARKETSADYLLSWLAELAGWLTGSLACQMDDWRDAKSPARQTVGTPNRFRQPSRRIVALDYFQAAETQTQAARHQERKLPGRQITKPQGCQTSKLQAPKPSGRHARLKG